MKTLRGSVLTTVTLAGEEYTVGPLTGGQYRRVTAALAKLPPPRPVMVDVQGLVAAMFQVPSPGDLEGRMNRPLVPQVIDNIRHDVVRTVQELVRESRARAEQWPPRLESPEGVQAILSSGDVMVAFLHAVLEKHNSGFNLEAAKTLAEDILLQEIGDLLSAVMPKGPEEDDPQADEIRTTLETRFGPDRVAVLPQGSGTYLVNILPLDGSGSGGDGPTSEPLPSEAGPMSDSSTLN